ncbi:hypothetical protein VTO42DRAFT_6477 [Malbranchea cinnamomea]
MDPPGGNLVQGRPPTSARKHKSMLSRSTSAPLCSSPERGHVQPASPEVISSLISSLSAISTPAQTHFDSFPTIDSSTAPPSPGLHRTEFVRDEPQVPSSPGFGMDYGAYRTPAEDSDHDFLHPDDAAAASPVVRMSKPPQSPRSPRSPLSRRSSRSLPDDAALLRSTSSRTSFASSRLGHDETSGFGVVSLEPGPRLSSISVASSSSVGKKSSRGPFGLLKKTSRELPRGKDADRASLGEGLQLNSSRSKLSVRSSPSMADLVEEEALGTNGTKLWEMPTSPISRGESAPNLNRWQPPADASSFSPGGIGSGRVIPTRESSLRHGQKRASSSKRRSARHSTYSSRDFTIKDDITEAKTEEDSVLKHIDELKDQQRNIRDETPCDNGAPGTAQATPSTAQHRQSTGQSSEPAYVTGNAQSGRAEPSLRHVEELRHEDIEESAPSPTVLTRRAISNNNDNNNSNSSNNNNKRNYSPLGSQVPNASVALDRSDSSHQKGMKRLSNSTVASDKKHHRRTFSGARAPVQRTSSIPDERPSSADSIDQAVETYLSSPRLTQKVPHPVSDRMIAFSEVGDPKGFVVFCCVGMGLTRYLTAFYDELARTLKLRLITPDRPGVGESEPCTDGTGTPLGWPDDLAIICNHLKITKFSLLAHSAGAIYALATALRMPQHIRGRIHLLAPWIPPSQMTGMGSHREPLPASALPYSQRILRALPIPFLKVANSSFMSATSASITSSLPKNSRRPKRRSMIARETPGPQENGLANPSNPASQPETKRRNSTSGLSQKVCSPTTADPAKSQNGSASMTAGSEAERQRQRQMDYDNRLTHAIWELATTNANPAVDLLVCLERRQPIGFRYADINRAVVIHHGSRDTRVPVDNVKWLAKTMRRCEVRVLEGEGHGLMASATVMGNVLMEIAKEWEDWTTVTQGRSGGRRATVTQR